MIVIAAESEADGVARALAAAGEAPIHLGEVAARTGDAQVVYRGALGL
jgi:hypothetical protein